MEKIVISCLESRVETNRRIYARFLLGPFKDDNAITIATALRRALLSKVKSIAITAIHIQGVTHEFSTIVGVRESVLDLALNFQQVVLRTKKGAQRERHFENVNPNLEGVKKRRLDQTLFSRDSLNREELEKVQIGYLQMQGPAVVYANDLKLPAGIECVDPTQHIATLSTEGLLVVKFLIDKKKASFDTSLQTKQVIPLNTKEKKPSTTNKTGQTSADQKVAYSRTSKELSLYAQKKGTKEMALAGVKKPAHPQSYPLDNPFTLFDPTICLRNTIFLDPIFDSVIQANYVVERDDLFNQVRERVVLEFWTNGSVHPRQALHKASLSLISTFSIFRKVFHLDSL